MPRFLSPAGWVRITRLSSAGSRPRFSNRASASLRHSPFLRKDPSGGTSPQTQSGRRGFPLHDGPHRTRPLPPPAPERKRRSLPVSSSVPSIARFEAAAMSSSLAFKTLGARPPVPLFAALLGAIPDLAGASRPVRVTGRTRPRPSAAPLRRTPLAALTRRTRGTRGGYGVTARGGCGWVVFDLGITIDKDKPILSHLHLHGSFLLHLDRLPPSLLPP